MFSVFFFFFLFVSIIISWIRISILKIQATPMFIPISYQAANPSTRIRFRFSFPLYLPLQKQLKQRSVSVMCILWSSFWEIGHQLKVSLNQFAWRIDLIFEIVHPPPDCPRMSLPSPLSTNERHWMLFWRRALSILPDGVAGSMEEKSLFFWGCSQVRYHILA